MMLVRFMEACKASNISRPLVAIAVDIRSGEFFDAKAVVKMIDEARSVGFVIDTLFIEAHDAMLVNRYKESRRDHPLASEGMSLEEAIAAERGRLQPLRETANHVIDTSELKISALQAKLRDIVMQAGNEPILRIELLSFGFKRGIPRDGDLVFDVRFLPNPFYIPELGHHTGLDQDVKDFVLNHPVTQTFLAKCMPIPLPRRRWRKLTACWTRRRCPACTRRISPTRSSIPSGSTDRGARRKPPRWPVTAKHALCDKAQQPVAFRMPENVVDQAEFFNVEGDHHKGGVG